MLNLLERGNRGGEMSLQTQLASGNCARDGVDNKFGRSKLHFHNMQISDYLYLEKVFKNLQ